MEASQPYETGMREHEGKKSLVRIIITKETKLSLRGQLHRTLGTHFSALFKG